MRKLFTYQDVCLEYLTLGSGKETILCFHGFGREAEDFRVFETLLKPHQKILAVNLLAHGNSAFPRHRMSKSPVTKKEWTGIITALLEVLEIDTFHLMGYSMGGRMAMVLTETLSQRISSLVLIAPDGLKIKWVYRFVSETRIGRKIYRHIIDHPRWILRIADSLGSLGLLHQKIHRFVHVQLETREKRQLVYDAWLIHRNLFPNLKEVATHIESNDIPFLLLFGKFDRVIPAHDGRRLTTHFTRPTHQFLLELGHRLLHPTTANFLGKYGWWMPRATPPK